MRFTRGMRGCTDKVYHIGMVCIIRGVGGNCAMREWATRTTRWLMSTSCISCQGLPVQG